jgi:hypothetical protein
MSLDGTYTCKIFFFLIIRNTKPSNTKNFYIVKLCNINTVIKNDGFIKKITVMLCRLENKKSPTDVVQASCAGSIINKVYIHKLIY